MREVGPFVESEGGGHAAVGAAVFVSWLVLRFVAAVVSSSLFGTRARIHI